jgi:cullin-4
LYDAESEERLITLKADPQAFFKHVQFEEEGLRAEAVLPVETWSLVREVTEKEL